MLKSEYHRSYQWNPVVPDDVPYDSMNLRHPTEPMMTHKRRVKLPEDNVLIGAPLTSQNFEEEDMYSQQDPYFVIGDTGKKANPDVAYRNLQAMKQRHTSNGLIEKPRKKTTEKSREERQRVQHRKASKIVNEAVQTCPTADKAIQIPPKKHDKSDNKTDAQVQVDEPAMRVSLPLSKSEYQLRYSRKEPIRPDPPTTEEVAKKISKLDTRLKIYNNFMSEYQQQFRPYEFVTENRYKRMKSAREPRIQDESHLQIVKPTQADRPRAVTPPPKLNFNNQIYRPQDTMNPQRLSFPHGKQRRFVTEYSANFDNKWEKLNAEVQRNIEEEAQKSGRQSRWYQEILDLRRKAQEHRLRSRGTHFSREHLAQIYVKDSRLAGETDDDADIDDYGKLVTRQQKSTQNNSPKRWAEPVREHRDKRTHSPVPNRKMSNSTGSVYSSNVSTIVEKQQPPRSDTRSPEYRQQWTGSAAGKPSFDNSLLLDEVASHDTDAKDERIYNDLNNRNTEIQQRNTRTQPERKYTFQRYFNENGRMNSREMETLDYDAVSKDSSVSKRSSTKSLMTSSTMSLARETLERARRNRDEILRQKM